MTDEPKRPPSSVPLSDQSAKFDRYAATYIDLQTKSMAASGEPPQYFARYKLECLERLVAGVFSQPVLDFGCGVGMLTAELVRRFSDVHAYDPSAKSLQQARHAAPKAVFHGTLDDAPDGSFALVILSGVLHHVPPGERAALLERAMSKLRPGHGRLVVFELNPLNPLTRHSVALCPFDNDAVLLWPWQARALLVSAGLTRVERRFIVFFPRALAALRGIEPHLGALPLGALMMLVGTRPG